MATKNGGPAEEIRMPEAGRIIFMLGDLDQCFRGQIGIIPVRMQGAQVSDAVLGEPILGINGRSDGIENPVTGLDLSHLQQRTALTRCLKITHQSSA